MLSIVREVAKNAGERVLWWAAPLSRRHRVRRNETLILAYHNVVPHGSAPVGEQSLHLPQAVFAEQLDFLLSTHDVVGLSELLESSKPIRSNRPRAAITFDDAYRGAVTAGVKELAKRGLPATFFVAPAFVPDGTFWWDLLADGWNGRVDEATREIAMLEFDGETERVRKWARERGVQLPDVPPHAHAATIEELRLALQTPGVELGSHTWSHCNLAVVSAAEAESQLRTSLAWLEQNFGASRYWLSYPYGNSTPTVEQIAQACGYAGAVKIAGGWYDAARDPRFAVPRLNIPKGLSKHGFGLRLAGLITK